MIVTVDGISFNAEWVNSKTEEQFLAEAELNKWFDGNKNKISKLKEAYKLCCNLFSKPSKTTASK